MAQSRLQQLLGALPERDFFNDYYGETWFHRKWAADADSFSGLVDIEDLERLLFDGDERNELIQAVGGEVTRDGIVESAPARHCSAQEAVDEWLAGRSLIFNGIDKRLPALSDFSRALESELKCRVWCNLYLTPARSHAFTTHYDTHDVFVIQIIGSKTWRVGASAAESPLPFQDRRKGGPDIADTHHQMVLQPGDVLYVPRGLLHDAIAQAELSCHITVGIHPKTYLDLILAAVAIAADRDARFRKYLPPGSFDVGESEIAAAVRLMGDILPADFRDAGDAFCELLASERRRTPIGALRLHETVDFLSDDDVFRATPNLMCSLSQREGIVELIALGRSIEFPSDAASDLDLCLSGRAFRLAECRAQASPADRASFVRRLILEGVVQKLGPHDDRSPLTVDVVKHVPPSTPPDERSD